MALDVPQPHPPFLPGPFLSKLLFRVASYVQPQLVITVVGHFCTLSGPIWGGRGDTASKAGNELGCQKSFSMADFCAFFTL